MVVEFDRRAFRRVMAGVMTALMLSAIDGTLITTGLPTIVGDLKGIDYYAWVTTASMLGTTVGIPLSGKFSDLYGRRQMLQVSIVVFTAGAVIAASTTTMAQLVVGRGVQGLGAGGLLALAYVVMADLAPPRERAVYIAMLTGLFASTNVAGPFIGGFVIDHLHWRWLFLGTIPIGAIGLVVLNRTVRYPFAPRRAKVDVLGALLLVGTVAPLVLLSSWGGKQFAWISPQSAALAVTIVGAGALFILTERRSTEPIVPMRLFANRDYRMLVVAALFLGTTQMGATVFLPLFLQVVKNFSATSSGLVLLPQMLSMTLATYAIGMWIRRTGRYRVAVAVTLPMCIAAVAMLTQLDGSTPSWYVVAAMMLLGAGYGVVVPVLTVAVQSSVGRDDFGVAGASNQFARMLGGSIGLAVFGGTMTSRLESALARRLPAGTEVTTTLVQSPKAVRALPADVRTGVVGALGEAVAAVYWVALPALVIAWVMISVMREVSLNPDDEPLSTRVAVEDSLDDLAGAAGDAPVALS